MAEEIRGATKGSLSAYYAALGKVDEDRKKKGLKPLASKFARAQAPYTAAGKSLAMPKGVRQPPTKHWAFNIKGAMRSHRKAFKPSIRHAFPRRRHRMRRKNIFGKL